MKNATRVGTIADIGIYVHWTFWVLIAAIFFFYLFQGTDVINAISGIALILALFLCVILHELGHALTARHYDVPTRDITLYPIGGVARLQRLPEEPLKELWIALAGPAVNLVIAAALYGYLHLSGVEISFGMMQNGTSVPGALMWMNLALAAFNLLPAFPMDGGRILRALLATRMSYPEATEIAANIGQFMAILFGLIGLVRFNPVLLFIAMFVYVGAQQESQQASMRALTQGIPVRHAMMTRFRTLSPEDTLRQAMDELLAGSDQDFPVLHDGSIVGVLTRRDLVKGLTEKGDQARVSSILQTSCITVEDSAMLDEAFAQMQAVGCNTVPVVHNGELVGVLTLENVGELLMVSSALRRARNRA